MRIGPVFKESDPLIRIGPVFKESDPLILTLHPHFPRTSEHHGSQRGGQRARDLRRGRGSTPARVLPRPERREIAAAGALVTVSLAVVYVATILALLYGSND